MTSSAGRDERRSPEATDGRGGWLPAIGVFALFLACSAFCRPVPSVNEPHYLSKAKHYWQPDWCAGDFFLESSNPHLVFYQTIGALTRWLTFPQAAWVGRIIVLAMLAWGWTRLTSRLSPHRWAPLGAACLFLLLQALGSFSGEWLVGGVESKVPAYALAFLGWASLIDRRPVSAAVWLGLAMSVHPVVGGWCVIAAALCWFVKCALTLVAAKRDPNTRLAVTNGSVSAKLAAVVLILCSLPGVLPALQTLIGSDAAASAAADRLQVGTRLAHHLDPMRFPVSAYRYYGLLILVWLMLRKSVASTPARRWFVGIVSASLVIALAGVIVGWGPRPIPEMPLAGIRIWLLKFYPFRLADILIPMLVAVTAVEAIRQWPAKMTSTGWRRWGGAVTIAAAFGLALWLPNPDKTPSRMSAAKQTDWLAACEWIRTQSPPGALLYAPNEHWAVKWFCERPEYVNYKDCPQDAAGILEWARRIKTYNQWHRDAFGDGRVSAEELQHLHEQTGITHLLVGRLGPIDTEPAYHNGSFRVYAISTL